MRNSIAYAVLAASLAGGCSPQPSDEQLQQVKKLAKEHVEAILNGVHIRDISVVESGVRTDPEDQKSYSYHKVRAVLRPEDFGGKLPNEAEVGIQLSLSGTWTVRDAEAHEENPKGKENNPWFSVPGEPYDGLLLIMPKSVNQPYILDVYITTPDAKDAENAQSQINDQTFKVFVER